MNAEILCVGTEILLGDIVNTNAQYLSEQLSLLGINVFHETVVGDNPERLSECLDIALARCDMVITTGGLGPTYDDLTKETIARKFGKKLVLDADSLARIERFFDRLGREMTENNRKQAYLPEGAEIFANDWGTAPACAISNGEKTAIMLPGPPREMKPIFEHCVRPYLMRFTDGVIVSHSIRIYGEGESAVETRLRDMMTGMKNPTVAPYAKTGEVLLRVTAKARDREQAEQMLEAPMREIFSIYGDKIYGVDVESMQQAAFEALRERGLKVASAESCTGGKFGQLLTAIPGASEVYDCGVISYANSIKHRLLGVSEQTLAQFGAVSEQCAREMAEGVRVLGGADIGVSITGIAGPGGGTPEKPVGTVYVGCADSRGCAVRRLTLGRGGDERELVRDCAVLAAFDMVRRAALGLAQLN